MMHRYGKTAAALVLGLMFFAGVAGAADLYPTKPIRLVLPFPPGSATDVVARIVAQKLGESLKQSVVVDSRPGANGIIASEAVAKAAPDGYTLILGSNGSHGINVSLFNKLPYDPVKDFAPITLVGQVSYFLIVGSSMPAGSVKEFIAMSKSSPGKRTLAYMASVGQLTGELFKMTAGIDLTSVPYKNVSGAYVDLASGQLDAMFETTASSLPHVKAGRVRALAVTSAKRSVLAPEVPTVAESGYPGFEAAGWTAFFAPAGTPKEIIAKLHTEIVRILQTPEVKEKMLQIGLEVVGSTPEQLEEAVKVEVAKWARVIKAANIPKMN